MENKWWITSNFLKWFVVVVDSKKEKIEIENEDDKRKQKPTKLDSEPKWMNERNFVVVENKTFNCRLININLMDSDDKVFLSEN